MIGSSSRIRTQKQSIPHLKLPSPIIRHAAKASVLALRSYHGAGFGGTSVGGVSVNRKAFAGALLPNVDHMPSIHNLEHNAFSRGQPTWGAHLADDLERLVNLRDPSTIAAVIVDPMAGSVFVPPQGYLQRLREITSKHGILAQ